MLLGGAVTGIVPAKAGPNDDIVVFTEETTVAVTGTDEGGATELAATAKVELPEGPPPELKGALRRDSSKPDVGLVAITETREKTVFPLSVSSSWLVNNCYCRC